MNVLLPPGRQYRRQSEPEHECDRESEADDSRHAARPLCWKYEPRDSPNIPTTIVTLRQSVKARDAPGLPGLTRAEAVWDHESPSMKVHLTTLGCPKNQVDSELMSGMLAQAGHDITEEAAGAECLVVNTCAFIDRAREESVNTILELARLKDHGRARALIVTGCLSQRYGPELLAEIPEVDGILGTSELHRIVELVNQAGGRQDWVGSAPRATSTTRRRRG